MTRHWWTAVVVVCACACGSVSNQPKTDAGGTMDASMQQLIVTPTTLVVPEGTTKTFDVLLGADPVQPVMVAIASSNAAKLPVSMSTITFTGGSEGTWKIPVQVSVSPPVDNDNVSEQSTITISAVGIASPVDVAATVQDTTVLAQFGWPAPPPLSEGLGVAPNFIVAFQITIDGDTTLDSFGVFNRLAVRDSLYRMALYRDASGRPGALVAQMAAPAVLAVGANVFDLTPDVSIDTLDTPAGHRFWLAVETSMGVNGSSSPTITTAMCLLGVNNITDPLPLAFDPTRCTTGAAAFNVWINTYHQ